MLKTAKQSCKCCINQALVFALICGCCLYLIKMCFVRQFERFRRSKGGKERKSIYVPGDWKC